MTSAETPQGRRRERVAERLRQALAALESDPDAVLTPTALARLAGVGRNTIYAGHRPMLDALASLRAARVVKAAPSSSDAADAESRAELASRIRALATRNAGLLRRALVAERHVADLEERNAELTRTIARLRKPAAIDGDDMPDTDH